ncbi:hypothetical protein CC79DRAFT_5758 [Sarocladium strictum]
MPNGPHVFQVPFPQRRRHRQTPIFFQHPLLWSFSLFLSSAALPSFQHRPSPHCDTDPRRYFCVEAFLCSTSQPVPAPTRFPRLRRKQRHPPLCIANVDTASFWRSRLPTLLRAVGHLYIALCLMASFLVS